MLDKSKLGHRQRLRKRFLQSGLDGFLDYEIIELLLTIGTPFKDCKKQAKELIKKFGSVKAILDARDEDLQQIKGIGPNNIFGIKFFRAVSTKYFEEKIIKKVELDTIEKIVKFLKLKIGNLSKEKFILIALNSRLQLIKVIEITSGLINSSLIHPREVFKEAIDCLATNIIIAHNHPSGDPNPSNEDIIITKRIFDSSVILQIELLDHIIVTNNSYFSFKEHHIII
jgi:DNA repair protein RadC